MSGAERPPPLPDLVCAGCGRPITWSRLRARYAHRPTGVVAVCDLDADHPVLPDWRQVDGLLCQICHGAVVVADGRFVHDGTRSADDHPADPGIPIG